MKGCRGTGDLFASDPEPLQSELPLGVPVTRDKPRAKVPGELTDLELLETKPKPSGTENLVSPTYTLRVALWGFWGDLYRIDSKFARDYRDSHCVNYAAICTIVNDILFGVESCRPEITPARKPRIERARAYLARYMAHRATKSPWEHVGLGDLP